LNKRDFFWYKLDNAAKIFPAVSSVTATNVFRLSARLKENINREILQISVENALMEMPSFKVKMHKGMFWYYFENNHNRPDIKEEYAYPCRKIDRYTNNGYLFDVTYFGENINCEVFHAIADGASAIKFLCRIVEHYIKISHKEIDYKIPKDTTSSNIAQNEDSFVRMTSSGEGESVSIVRPPSYQIQSILTYDNEIKIIKGIMSTSQMKALAKEKGVTITVLLSAFLIYSIYLESFLCNPKNKPIDLCVPVNLRQFFPSQTARNFFTSIPVGVNFFKKNYSLDEVIAICKKDFEEQLTESSLYSKVKYGVEFQNKMYLRFLPLFLKNIGLKLAFKKGEKGYSSVLSNLGNVKLPEEISPYVERFEFFLSPTRTNRYKTSMCSFGDKMVFAFTTNVENTDIQKKFFTLLVENNIDVTISSNDTLENEKTEEGKL